jgi:hypothetical protein
VWSRTAHDEAYRPLTSDEIAVIRREFAAHAREHALDAL